MMVAHLQGGPLDGEIRALPGGTRRYEAPQLLSPPTLGGLEGPPQTVGWRVLVYLRSHEVPGGWAFVFQDPAV